MTATKMLRSAAAATKARMLLLDLLSERAEPVMLQVQPHTKLETEVSEMPRMTPRPKMVTGPTAKSSWEIEAHARTPRPPAWISILVTLAWLKQLSGSKLGCPEGSI